ncbi:MAG TPA: hypothetical protein VEW47_11335 [Candidatus Dormibacteraeota bacterium]|nr:hypothetical protein [Candidatus Dormibacteraeota bacterium]
MARRGLLARLVPVALLLASPGMSLRGADAPGSEAMQAPGSPGPRQVFEENRGQAGALSAFVSRCSGFSARLDAGGIDIVLPGRPGDREADVVRLVFPGARTSPAFGGVDPLPRRVNYFVGADPRGWITSIPTFAGVRYPDLYPGVDLTVSGDYRRVVLDFALDSGADGDSIALGIERPGWIEAGDTPGSALLGTAGGGIGALRLSDVATDRHEAASLSLRRGLLIPDGAAGVAGKARRIRLGLERADTDREARPDLDTDLARIALDGEGNMYVAGRALAAGPGDAEAFIARFGSDGASGYTTYFGGGAEDVPLGLAVGEDGGVVVAGWTRSGDFPLARAVQPERRGPGDAFVMRLAADGSLVYSTYLGGDGEDEGRAVTLDASGAAWIAGRTGRPGSSDAFVAALRPNGSRLRGPTTLGAGGDDSAEGIGLDGAGRVWVAGTGSGDAFVAVLPRDGEAPIISTRLGGSGDDAAAGFAIDPSGAVFVAGDGFVAVVAEGTDGQISIDRIDHLDGSGHDRLLGIAAGGEGTAWVAGWTEGMGLDLAPGQAPLVARVDRSIGGHGLEVTRQGRPPRAPAGEPTLPSRLTGIALDPEGRPFVAGIEAAGGPHTAWVIEAARSGGVIFAGPALEGPGPAAAGCPGTIVFDNTAGTGLWQTAQNWDTNVLPGPSDDVCIPAGMTVTLGSGTQSIGTVFVESGASLAISGGSLSIAAPSQVNGGFVFSGGTLTGAGEVTMSGAFTWTAGIMTGTGMTNANAGITFSGASIKDISGGRVLATAGTTTWTGGPVRPGSGAVIRNNGTWDVQGDTSMMLLGSPAPRFDNLAGATFRKSAGAGTMSANFPFNNDGTLSVQSGTVSLTGGGTGAGTFSASPGATLAFNGGTYSLLAGSFLDATTVVVGNATTLDVSGSFNVSGSTSVTGTGVAGLLRFNPAATVTSLGTSVTLALGILELNSGDPINLTGLSLSGTMSMLRGSDNVTVSDPIAWTTGTMTGTGTTNANGGIAFSGAGVKDIAGGRVLNTAATTTWTGGFVRAGAGALIRNSGVWDVQGDNTMDLLSGASPLFVNLTGGTFRRSAGTGTLNIKLPFENAGALSVLSGTVSLIGGGSGDGTFSASPGATLAFNGVTYSLLAGSFLDATTVVVGNATTLDVSGSFNVSGSTSVTGTGVAGLLRFNPAATVTSLGTSVTLALGILELNSGDPINLTGLSLTATESILRGSDNVTVSDPITWTAGSMTGTGTTNANGGIAFSGASVKDITGGRVLATAGTTTWTGGPVRPGSGAVIRNSGLWDIQGDTSMTLLASPAPRFDNLAGGTFQKSAGGGTSSSNVAFTNAGNVRGMSGTLSFSAGYTQNAGSTTVAGGVISSTTPLDIQGGSVGGSGTLAAAVTNAGRLAPGLSPGAVTISGTYTQTAAASYDVEIGGPASGTDYDIAAITGVAGLAGTLNVTLVNGFSPADLDTFTIMTFPSSVGSFAAANLPALGGDLIWKIHHDPNSIVLEVLADLDGDGVRNSTDCAPQDPTLWAVPADITSDVFLSGGPTFSWTSLATQAGPATTYDVVRGLISQLPVGGGASETCLTSGNTATQVTDATTPPSRPGFYYLVRGVNACGVGTYGTTTSGAPRVTAACP